MKSKSIIHLCMMLAAFVSLADIVQIDFDVRDYEGNPIEGVNIKCSRWEKPASRFVEAKTISNVFATDADGKVSAKFDSWNGYINCHFMAEGYYPEEMRDVIFRAPYVEKTGRYVFKETQKSLVVKMRKIVNPVSMVYHQITKGDKDVPSRGGKFGYDLEIGDWTAPAGRGKVADFIVVCDWQEDTAHRCCTGAIAFVEKGCGAYIRKKHPCTKFPVDYSVDGNAEYKTYFPFSWKRDLKTKEYVENDIMQDDEYMVIRSRVKLDAKGDILEANYSQIQGPIGIGYYFAIGSSFFNPRVNDLNLEYVQPCCIPAGCYGHGQ